MPLQKNIVTPAGNTLGMWGVITRVAVLVTPDNETVANCALSLYASKEAAAVGKPAVGLYTYPLNVKRPSGADAISIAEQALLAVEDAGNFSPSGSQSSPGAQGWRPGWSGAEIVA